MNDNIFNKNIFKKNIDENLIKNLSMGYNSNGQMTQNYSDAIRELSKHYASASKEANALKMAQDGLAESTVKDILAKQGYTEEEIKAAVATEEFTTAQNVAKISTDANTGSVIANTVAYKALSIAKNIAIGLAIGAAVTGVTMLLNKAITSIASKIPTEKNIEKASDEAKKNIDELQNTLKEHVTMVNKVKERYAELAQEVDGLGTRSQNKGNLSTDEYSEFLDLSDKLVNMFPELNRGMNENGETILSLSGNVDTITSSIQRLIDAEKELANQKTKDKFGKVWKDYAEKVKKDKNKQNFLSRQSNAASDLNNYLTHGEMYFPVEYTDVLQEAIVKAEAGSNAGLFSLDVKDGEYVEHTNLSNLTDEEFEAVKKQLGILLNEYTQKYNSYEKDITKQNNEIMPYLNTWFDGLYDYSGISDDMLQVVQNSFSGDILYDLLPDNINKKNSKKVTDWFENNLIESIKKIDGTDIGKELQRVLLGGVDSSVIQELVDTLLSIDGFNEKNPLIIYLKTKLTDQKSIEDETRNAVEKFISDKGYSKEDQSTLISFIEEQGIDKDKNKHEQFLKLIKDGKSLNEVIKDYLALQEVSSSTNYIDSISDDDISKYKTQIEKLSEYLISLRNKKELSSEEKVDLNKTYGIYDSTNDGYISKIVGKISDIERTSTLITGLKKEISECSDAVEKARLQSILNDLLNLDQEAYNVANGFNNMSNAISTIKSRAQVIKSIHDDMKSVSKINISDLEQVIELYPELTEAVLQYNTGLIDRNELFNLIEQSYKEDQKKYGLLVANKMKLNNDFYDQVKNNIPKWLNALAESYGLELNEYKNYAAAKLAIDSLYENKKENLHRSKASTNNTRKLTKDGILDGMDIALEKQEDKLKSDKQIFEDAKKIVNEFNNIVAGITMDMDWDDLTEESGSKFEEKIDWTENSLNNLQNAVDDAQRKLDNTYGLEAQIKAIDELNKALENLKDGYSKAANAYGSEFNKNKNKLAKVVGKDQAEKYAGAIRSGKVFKKEDFKSKKGSNGTKSKEEQAYELIEFMMSEYQNEQKYLDSAEETDYKIKNNKTVKKWELKEESRSKDLDVTNTKLNDPTLSAKEKNALLDEQYNKQKSVNNALRKQAEAKKDKFAVEKLNQEDKNNNIQRKVNKLQNSQDENKESVSLYDSLLNDDTITKKERIEYINQEQKARLKDQRYDFKKALTVYGDQKKLLKVYNKATGKDLKSITAKDITDLNDDQIAKIVGTIKDDNISNLFQTMINQKQKDKFEDFEVKKSNREMSNDFWDNKINDIDNNIALNNGVGTKEQYTDKKSYYENKKQNYIALKEEAQKNRKDAVYGTKEWQKWDNQVQDLQNDILSCDKGIKECNESILELPLKQIDIKLNEIKNKINEINESVREENAYVEAAIAIYDGQIDTQNKLKEVIQDKIDLLQKEWSLRKENVAVQKAEWNLQKLKEQKSSMIFKGNGQGWQYESDESELRDAVEALQEAEYSQTIANYQNQIDNIDLNIKYLERSKRNWEEINTEASRSASIVAALKYDSNVINNVLSGDLGFIQKIKSELTDAAIETKELTDMQSIYESMQGKIDYVVYLRTNNLISKEEAEQEVGNIVDEYDGILAKMNISDEKKQEFKKLASDAINNVKIVSTETKSVTDKVTKNIKDSFDSVATYYKELGIDNIINESTNAMAYSYASFATSANKEIDKVMSKIDALITKMNSIPSVNTSVSVEETSSTGSKSKSNKTPKSSGKQSVTVINAGKNHDGVAKGAIGHSTSDTDKIRLIALDKLKSDEIPRILQTGEVVMNSQQIQTTLDNFKTAYTTPNIPIMKAVSSDNNISFNGDIVISNPIGSSDSLAREIKMNLSNVLKQELYR